MELLFLMLALASIVWGGILLLRGGLMAGCLLLLLAGSCFGHAFWNMPLGPAPLTLDRLLWGVLIVQFLLLWKFRQVDHKPWGAAEWLLTAFIVVLGYSTFSHDWQVDHNRPAATFVFFYFMPFVFYWVARQMPITERGLWWTWGGLAVFGMYLAVTAIAEVKEQWWMVFPKYIGFRSYAEYFGRGRGPYLNPTGAGIMLTAGLVACWMWWPRATGIGRVAIVGITALLATGAYFTLTRSVWMGAALAATIVVGLTLPRTWRWPAVLAISLCGVVLLATRWESLMSFKRDKDVSAEDVADSATLRPILAAVAWEMFLDRPLLGCGYGQYKLAHNFYLAERKFGLNLEKARPYVQHNTFLSLLTETGLIGLALFAGMLAVWSLSAWRLWRSQCPLAVRQWGLFFLAFLSAYIVNGMFHDTSLIPNQNMFLFFVGALTSGLTARWLPACASFMQAWPNGWQSGMPRSLSSAAGGNPARG